MLTYNKLIGFLSQIIGFPLVVFLKLRGVRIGLWSGVRFFGFIKIHDARHIAIGAHSSFGRFVRLSGAMHIGAHVFLNEFCSLNSSRNAPITIGDGTSFGPDCYIVTGDHDISPNAAINLAGDPGGKSGAVTIGRNCWLGAKVIVLKNVTIGDGAVIGAGSVVTSNIPARAIAVGNPARVIKTRY
jgi:acetyltransferase-like isoleucine patch superfamily enzyme